MKKLLPLLLLIMFGCKQPPSENSIQFSGTHELRKFKTVVSTENHLSGSYFLIAESIDGESKVVSKVTFSWKMNDGS